MSAYARPSLRFNPCVGKSPEWHSGSAHRAVKIGWTSALKLTTGGSVVVVVVSGTVTVVVELSGTVTVVVDVVVTVVTVTAVVDVVLTVVVLVVVAGWSFTAPCAIHVRMVACSAGDSGPPVSGIGDPRIVCPAGAPEIFHAR